MTNEITFGSQKAAVARTNYSRTITVIDINKCQKNFQCNTARNAYTAYVTQLEIKKVLLRWQHIAIMSTASK